MVMSSADIKHKLITENIQFKRLFNKHQSYEKRLDDLNRHYHLTSEEEREMADIKKQKLQLKDRMQVMIEQYRFENSG